MGWKTFRDSVGIYANYLKWNNSGTRIAQTDHFVSKFLYYHAFRSLIVQPVFQANAYTQKSYSRFWKPDA